jgi:AcrR family transcriptional regulator
VLGEANTDRKAARHSATRREILDAAWELVRAEGLAALSLRELATRVGMRAPSLYAYFASKAAIYDAMFAEGYEELLRRRASFAHAPDPRAALVAGATDFAVFCTEDPARYQLLFQRTIPGFEPSPDAYEPAVQALALARQALVDAGIDDPAALDVWTALLTGLVDQQISNDPGGDRWTRLIPDAVDMFLAHHGRRA